MGDIGIGYDEDLSRVEKIIKEHLSEIGRKHKAIVKEPTYLGVQELSSGAVTL